MKKSDPDALLGATERLIKALKRYKGHENSCGWHIDETDDKHPVHRAVVDYEKASGGPLPYPVPRQWWRAIRFWSKRFNQLKREGCDEERLFEISDKVLTAVAEMLRWGRKKRSRLLTAERNGVRSGEPTKRPAYHRDHLFASWYEAKGEQTHHSHAKIRDKWNGIPRNKRRSEYPTAPDDVDRAVVISAIKAAKKDGQA